MWTNANMKEDAKFHLRGAWPTAIGVLLIISIITSILTQIISSVVSFVFIGGSIFSLIGMQNFSDPNYFNSPENVDLLLRLIPLIIGVGLITTLLASVVSIFVSLPLGVSAKNWFIRNRETPEAPEFGLLFNHYAKNFKKLVFAAFWQSLWILIWSLPMVAGTILYILAFFTSFYTYNLPDGTNMATMEPSMNFFIMIFLGMLLIFVGNIIVLNRSYAYFMMFSVMADNPDVGGKRAMELSKKMMKGNKLHLLGLQLSFIGWILLTMLTCGIGLVVLNPYIEQTNAEVYARLRSIAVERGDTTMEELGFVSLNQSSKNTMEFAADPRYPHNNFNNNNPTGL